MSSAAATPPFSLLVKPAGPDCNLRCAYCFYLDRSRLYPESDLHRMSAAVLESTIRSYMATPQPQYVFGWQGGEPTLMGLDFFRRVIQLQQRCGHPGAVVSNGLQTNGTLLDDAFAAHLAEYRFLVGISIDGPPDLHNRFRVTGDGHGSYDAVNAGLEALRRQRVEFNALTLVSQANVGAPERVYRHLRDHLGIFHHQYIECVEFDRTGAPLPYAIGPAEWGEFLCRIFDLWHADDTRRVSVRLFDALLARLLDGTATMCTMGEDCRQYFVVEHNGDIYPCDFHVAADWRLGNVLTDKWQALWHASRFREFGARKRALPASCARCPHLDLCQGDCPRNRHTTGLSHLCAGWRHFFDHARPRLEALADEVRRERQGAAAAGPHGHALRPAGRNLPCPCGSGRKYKHCCGAAPATRPQ